MSISLTKPTIGSTNWGTDVNNNFTIIENAVNAISPAGALTMFAGSTTPTGWLECDGSAVSRTTYADLFAAIGTTWGSGNGTTTFNIPDLRGRAPIGAGQGSGLSNRTLGNSLGAETVQLSTSEIPSHNHSFVCNSIDIADTSIPASNRSLGRSSGANIYIEDSGSTPLLDSSISNTGGGGAHNNMQPSAVVKFIIKT